LYRICSLRRIKIKVKVRIGRIVLGIKVATLDKEENRGTIFPRNRKPLLLLPC
jgi:hypothetical protein